MESAAILADCDTSVNKIWKNSVYHSRIHSMREKNDLQTDFVSDVYVFLDDLNFPPSLELLKVFYPI